MSPTRWLVLLLGPPLIIGGLYLLTMPAAGSASSADRPVFGTTSPPKAAGSERELSAACRRRAAEVASLLEGPAAVLVRPPYVLAGNVPQAELERRYREVIIPLERALSADYFDHKPDRPVTILMFADGPSFRRHAARVEGASRDCYAGYYLRDAQRVVVDLSTGNGTLAHELTHALAHFDFPEMPEWLDEGLAALHEESEFSPDGLRLEGRPNWRIRYLMAGLREGRLRTLRSLVAEGGVRSDREAVDYAQARYFCLYLQQRRLLAPFYRKFRATAAWDPTGEAALKELLGVSSLDEIETEFRVWAERQWVRGSEEGG